MLGLSRGPRNCSVEPARRMAKIGTGLNMARLAPSKSGLYSPPTPTMTVQVPDTDGTMGNSKGGAGNVNAVWADAESKTAPMVPNAVRNAAKSVRCAPPLVDERTPARTASFMERLCPPGHFGRVGSCGSERQDGTPTLPLDCLRRGRPALREMFL